MMEFVKRRSVLSFALLSGVPAACGSGDPPRGFTNRLRIPPLAEPVTDPDGAKRFALELRPGGRSAFLPGKASGTWGINGDHLGPTVRARRGDRIRMAVTNRLGETSTLHWHGMRLPARMDGGPHQMIDPGTTWTAEWTTTATSCATRTKA
jgi:suppressor of ftsI